VKRSVEDFLELKKKPAWIWLGPFVEGAQDAFAIQFENPVLKIEQILGNLPKSIPLDIYSFIAVRGEVFAGECVLGFSKATYLTLLKKLFDEDYSEITPENQDGTGEIVNMIFGKAKSELNKIGYGIQMARPEIKSCYFPLRQDGAEEERYFFILETAIGKVFFGLIRGPDIARN